MNRPSTSTSACNFIRRNSLYKIREIRIEQPLPFSPLPAKKRVRSEDDLKPGKKQKISFCRGPKCDPMHKILNENSELSTENVETNNYARDWSRCHYDPVVLTLDDTSELDSQSEEEGCHEREVTGRSKTEERVIIKNNYVSQNKQSVNKASCSVNQAGKVRFQVPPQKLPGVKKVDKSSPVTSSTPKQKTVVAAGNQSDSCLTPQLTSAKTAVNQSVRKGLNPSPGSVVKTVNQATRVAQPMPQQKSARTVFRPPAAFSSSKPCKDSSIDIKELTRLIYKVSDDVRILRKEIIPRVQGSSNACSSSFAMPTPQNRQMKDGWPSRLNFTEDDKEKLQSEINELEKMVFMTENNNKKDKKRYRMENEEILDEIESLENSIRELDEERENNHIKYQKDLNEIQQKQYIARHPFLVARHHQNNAKLPCGHIEQDIEKLDKLLEPVPPKPNPYTTPSHLAEHKLLREKLSWYTPDIELYNRLNPFHTYNLAKLKKIVFDLKKQNYGLMEAQMELYTKVSQVILDPAGNIPLSNEEQYIKEIDEFAKTVAANAEKSIKSSADLKERMSRNLIEPRSLERGFIN